MVSETYEIKAYREGVTAYRAGTPETSNPYQHPLNDFFQWQRGFLEARADSLQAQRGGDAK